MNNRYAAYLTAAGVETFDVGGHIWQRYKGVMLPAYLPHAVPSGIGATAAPALKISGALLARWTEKSEHSADSDWWFVLYDDGPYSKQKLSANTRSKVSRGNRRLEARPIAPDVLLREGYAVCVAASQRYGTNEFLPKREDFERRVRAAGDHPEVVEYWGVYRGDVLIAFSENHIQDGAVFMESIWYDPDGLRDYSSYVLMDSILDEYINHRSFSYVSDGSRSIYHDTGVHDFLVEKFGFRRDRTSLRVAYKPTLRVAVRIARRALPWISSLPRANSLRVVRRLKALVLQDEIARGAGK